MNRLFNEVEAIHSLYDMPEAEIYYYPNFIGEEQQDEIYKELYNNIAWQQDEIKVFGKIHTQPRLTALYASHNRPYSYSSISMRPTEFTPLLQELKQKIEVWSAHQFNTCLLNLYRNGKDSNGWHADDEKELGKNPVIASLSLGASRRFRFRRINDKKNTHTMELESGSLLLMAGKTQHYWQHQLPKTKKDVAPRINLTFRTIVASQ